MTFQPGDIVRYIGPSIKTKRDPHEKLKVIRTGLYGLTQRVFVEHGEAAKGAPGDKRERPIRPEHLEHV